MGRISYTPNAQIMKEAHVALSVRWTRAVGLTAILLGIYCLSIPLGPFGTLLNLVINGPLAIGMAVFFLQIIRGGTVRVSQLFSGFDRFLTGVVAYFLVMLFALLWALLLLVPGILAMFSYAMTFYILADEPSMSARDAIRKSRILMFGNRWKFFCLGCRFIGWCLLGIATLGIGFLWILPYLSTSIARFYLDIRDLHVKSETLPLELAYGWGDQ